MKRLIVILVCSFVSAAILLAQTDSPQAPAAPVTTTPKTSVPPAKTGVQKTTTGNKTSATTSKTGASTTTTSKTTSAATSKTGTSNSATSKTTTGTASKTGTSNTATSRTTSVAGARSTASKTSPPVQWTTTGSGLKYRDVVVGKGPVPKPGDDILVNYTGRFTNGKIFDSSLAPGRGPFELHLGRGEVIKGWDEGLSTMHVGGKRKLTIPPGLAYGPGGYPGVIPPNSTLTFDVELLKIK